MSDYQKYFFVKTAGYHLGFQVNHDQWENEVENVKYLNDFLTVGDVLSLNAYLERINKSKRLKFDHKVYYSDNFDKIVIFYKSSPCVITEENLSLVQTITVQGSPTTALYHALGNVFLPLLSQVSVYKTSDDSSSYSLIQNQITNLQAGLRNLVCISSEESPLKNEFSDSLTVIQSLDHELEYWTNVLHNSSKNKKERQKAESIVNSLQQLIEHIGVLDAIPLSETEEALESAHNSLDDLWRSEFPYPKARMKHLMDLIGQDLTKCICKHIKNRNIWTEDFFPVSEMTNQCVNVGEYWLSTCKQLTEIFWPNYSLHVWNDEPYVPLNLSALVSRLKEILTVRAVHRQIVRLLTSTEIQDLKASEAFQPFQEIEFLRCDPYTQSQWKTAVKKFEYLLQPAEQKVALKLRKQLGDTSVNTQQLLHECTRYAELISRPVVKQMLQTERQYLLDASKRYLHELSTQMTSEVRANFKKYDTSQTVDDIITLRQLEFKIKSVEDVSGKLLDDLDGFEELKQTITQSLREIKQQHSDLFDSWTNEIYTKIKSNLLSLKETDPVVQFSKEKMMQVNYSPRLVTLIREVRQLSAFGHSIPQSIMEVAELAKKFMNYARILEQIANFHNTIGDRMIPSQRPMMLASAVRLSKLVQEQEVITWGDVKSVERYVNSLKEAVEKLSDENNFLTAHHTQIMEKISEMEDVDLVKQFQKWKDTLKYIQNAVDQIQMKGLMNMNSWKSEIDKQFAIVLEKQYLKGLDTLHLYLPEIHTELVYRNSELQFSPTEDVLKEKYNQQLKRFLDIPKKLRGVSETSSGNVFTEIVERNTDHLDIVNKHRDDLFEQLKSVKKHWESWLTLKNLEASQLKTWQNWDIQFRASKTFGQEIAKLPSTEERVGCFIVGLSWLRMDLENHNRSYWSQLVETLKDAIAQEVFKLQQFVDASTSTLNRRLLTIDQIGEVDFGFTQILKEKSEMEVLFKEMLQKAQTLSSWTREQVDSVNRLQAAWERLQSLLNDHEHIIARQVETMKITLNIATENLLTDLERFEAKYEQIKSRPDSGHIETDSLDCLETYLRNIKEKRTQWDELNEKKNKLLNDYTRFSMDPPVFPLFDEVEADLQQQENLWKPFEDFYSELNRLQSEEWIVFRKKIYRLEEFLTAWELELQKSEGTFVTTKLIKEIINYKSILPVIKYLRGEDFTEKHWAEVFALLEISSKSVDNICLKDFLVSSERIIEHEIELQAIAKKAASEIIVRQALTELDQWDFQTKFSFIVHTDSRQKTILLVKDFKDVLNKIGDNQSLLQSVKNTSDYENFSEQVISWESRLSDLDNYLTSLAQIQRKWLYLEPIFVTGTLSHERNRFDRVNRDFRHILAYIEKELRVTSIVKFPNIRSVLNNLQDQLSKCQHSLDNFLTEKRKRFPRFLFLSDDDLLEIIGQSSKENVIQSHLKKMFGGINSIKLDSSQKNIVAMCSLEGETVQLNQPVNINQPIEDWLNSLVNEMQLTLKTLLAQCLSEGKSADPLKYPSQILCLAESITFTKQCEKAISGMTLAPLLGNYKAQLSNYSSLEFNDSDETVNNNGNPSVLELKLKALVLDTIYHISVLEELILANVTKDTDWLWKKQLRFYSDSSGNVTIRMVNAEFEYSYEYLGNQHKLVRTSLTDKCFLTLTQGMHLGMGGNPYGPAGTGKTETVKALGSLLGRQVLVFNCDEAIDATSMGKILFGLVQCGAWGCFDEFNRLDEATLSAISMHIQSIQRALYVKQDTLSMLDQEIKVNKHSGVFVTLNPAGGEYGARNRLPDNLKQLFRPVVMTHPDHEDIATTLLHCDGYRNAKVIANKIVEVFSSASKLLSSQKHYDWGLRALRTVIFSCGQYMKQYYRTTKSPILNLDIELQFVVDALCRNTLSRLTYSDSKKFKALIEDVFPAAPTDEDRYRDLKGALEESCRELHYQLNERQIEKCIEFYEQLKQRMGIALVGPSGTGKTALRTLLFHALRKIGISLKQRIFNPKSMNKALLFGQIDADTRQWYDGVLTVCSLQATSEPYEVWSWIVCDGDIDPEWIESLNSVLDDNRLLSLPSGWQIKFGPNVNFVFETDNLDYASPATISRLGIVFLNEGDFSTENYVDAFINGLDQFSTETLSQFIQDHFYKALEWIIGQGETALPCSKICLVRTALLHVQDSHSKVQFLMGLLNGFGSQLLPSFKELYANQLFGWFDEIPPRSSLFCRFNDQLGLIESYDAEDDASLSERIYDEIPLIKTAAINYTLDILRKYLQPGKEQHFLLVGDHGSAKTLVLEQLVKEKGDCELATIHCSAQVTPDYVTYKLSQVCMVITKSNKRVYKPNKGSLVLYFKNLQLLKNDQWGTNILTAFLQQIITYRGFYDSNLDWMEVENVVVVGSLAPVKRAKERFTSLFNIFCINSPTKEDLHLIFLTYLSLIVEMRFQAEGKDFNASKIVSLITSIYEELKRCFSSTHYRHYDFTPHDLTKLCKSIRRYMYDNETNLESFIVKIILHECQTIFRQKLATEEDKQKFDNILQEAVREHWNYSHIIQDISQVYYVPSQQFEHVSRGNSLMKLKREEWIQLINKGIRQYESEEKQLDVQIIPEILTLTSTIAKTLSEPKGNVLLIGTSGVGRKSAAKIVSVLQSAKLICPNSPFKTQFNNDLKMAMQIAGIEGKTVYFLLEDFIMQNQDILNLVDVLISSGEVPGLFVKNELESLTAGLKDDSDNESFDGNLINFFIHRVHACLHFIVCLDANNPELRITLDACPALYQKCSIVWLSEWTSETMHEIPHLIINSYLTNSKEAVEIEKVNFYDIHHAACEGQFSPFQYITLLKTYIDIYTAKKQLIKKQQEKLKAGISKLNEAKDVVKELKIKASQQEEQLSLKQSKANSALDMISNTMKNANNQKKEMEVLKQHTEEESEKLARRKQEIEIELSEVKPLIEEARSAVGNIKSEALTEIRSLRAPPDIIRDILEGVLRLMGTQDTSWNSMKNFLSKRGVKEDIRSFDASRISTENRQAVERLMNMKKDSFNPKIAKRASVAAAPLAAWVTANVRYSHVLDKIKPLEKEQYKLQKNLENAQSELEDLSAGLSNVDTTVAKLKDKLSTYTREAAEIEVSLKAARETLENAEGLVNKLDDEYRRWQDQIQNLSEELRTLPGNALLASAFIVYLSGNSEDERTSLLDKWKELLEREYSIHDFGMEKFLSTEREHLQWLGEGLSNDQLSIQNAIVLLTTKVCPLLIDPSTVALKWLKEHFKDRNVETIVQDSSKFNTSLELAVRFGKVLIIEEVDHVSPVLYSILRKEFSVQGKRKLICIGGKQIDYHENFFMILATRNTSLTLPADIRSFINVIKFVTSTESLTEQLLNSVIQKLSPDLEMRKKELLHQQEELEAKQMTLQEQLLEDLANSSEDILTNKDLITSLNKTKSGSDAISKALLESIEVKKRLQHEYDVYKEISQFGSVLFFAASSFSKFNRLYSLSIKAFTRQFLSTLTPFEENGYDLKPVQTALIQSVYNFVGRGIFKADRLTFALFLVHKLFPNVIPEEQWEIFLGKVSIRKGSNVEEIPSWIPNHQAPSVAALQACRFYKTLQLENRDLWGEFMQSYDCEKHFPKTMKITEFEKLLVVQCLRPDRLHTVLTEFVLRLTGLRSLHPEILQFSKIFKESANDEPILIIISSGNDPSTELKALAEDIVGKQKYIEISMGKGQEDKALKSLLEAAKLGQWLILKNLHLVTSWLSILCQTIQTLEFHEDFRLWLVTEEHNEFSSVLAENCLKVVFEAPQGIKSNILRSYSKWGPQYINSLNPTSSRIFFVLACIHAVLQERRTYIPQGWSKWYEFSDTDLSTIVKLSEEIWKMPNIAYIWKYLEGLSLDAVYGGRIEKNEDFSILKAYLRQYLTDEVLSHRWRPLGLNSAIPSSANFDDYIKAIQLLNSRDVPSYFGLPSNIQKAWEKTTSTNIISKLKETYFESAISNDSKVNMDEWQKGLISYMVLWKKLNQGHSFIKENLHNVLAKGDPIEVFLFEEYKYGITLMQEIHKTLSSLNSILKGNSPSSDNDIKIAKDLLQHKIPSSWSKIWNRSDEPVEYLKHVVLKVRKIFDWKNVQPADDLLKLPISLSYFFHPEGFLAAYKQDFARKNNIPMDELVLQTSFTRSPNKKYIVLTGLLIEGALFDGRRLTPCESNSESVNPSPDCQISWLSKGSSLNTQDYLHVPLYSSKREKLLAYLQIPCESKEMDTWIKAALAFFIEL